jgi:hypothetical protein
MNKMMLSALCAATMTALTACPSVGAGPVTTPSPASSPGTISGQALDSSGKPIAGALVWVEPSLTGGLVTAHTDANGRYRVQGLLNQPYDVYAWAQPKYNGAPYCLRLGHDTVSDYDPLTPASGATRDFRWQLEGAIPDRGEHTFFGGTVRLMPASGHDGDFNLHAGLTMKLTFTPTGPLVDGSPGKTVTRTINWEDTDLAEDVPVGAYRVSATVTDASGQTVALEVGANGSGLGASTTLTFAPTGGVCGGDFGNGTARVLVDIARP